MVALFVTDYIGFPNEVMGSIHLLYSVIVLI